MKLNIVPARTGIQWVKLGIRTFGRQPLALTALFFMYMSVALLLSIVPFVGPLLGMGIVPGATLGLMAATQDAENGKFPTPLVLLSAFRAGRERLRAMLVLGLLYAACLFGIRMVVALVADSAALPATVDPTQPLPPELLESLLLGLVLFTPVSIMFWHAPALVHWHGVSPMKSLFFSTVACLRNWRAMALYGIAWFLLMLAGGMLISTIAMLSGQTQPSVGVAMPFALLVATVFSTSLYFTFRDSFVADEPTPESQPAGDSP